MHELVKKYLDEGKAKERDLLDEEDRKKKEERDKYLLSLGLVASTERRYNKTYERPFVYWDKEKEMYFYDAEIPVEVSDDELEEIKKYEKFHKGEATASTAAKSTTINNGAEETLSTINSIFFILALIAAFIIFIMGMSNSVPGMLLDAVIIALGATITWAAVKVYVNISNNLHELNAKVKKE